ncbi:MAG: hypothetical protein GYA55_14240 [SAR324 cluster bacterium]|uniref:Uncharacterized protein n=1 Tax=SAR324 cluster bacterium TaxID=2024889 RepID=A0A7X9IMR0_9DELT|nr:hypothetical protein [SAR324 cluster bacterium]
MKIRFLLIVILLIASFIFVVSSHSEEAYNRLSRNEILRINSLNKRLFDKLQEQFADSSISARLPYKTLSMSPRQERKVRKSVKSLESFLRRVAISRETKQEPAKSNVFQISPASMDNCVSACAWAGAWTHASCYAKVCAWCPGRKIWFCSKGAANGSARSAAYSCAKNCGRFVLQACKGN